MPELFGRGGKVSILLLVYLQRLSCADIVASQAIPATQLADTDTITLCDSTQRVTILYLVVDVLLATDTVRRFLNSSAWRWL